MAMLNDEGENGKETSLLRTAITKAGGDAVGLCFSSLLFVFADIAL